VAGADAPKLGADAADFDGGSWLGFPNNPPDSGFAAKENEGAASAAFGANENDGGSFVLSGSSACFPKERVDFSGSVAGFPKENDGFSAGTSAGLDSAFGAPKEKEGVALEVVVTAAGAPNPANFGASDLTSSDFSAAGAPNLNEGAA
jgi:hypothetical protein